jgi:LysR family transcriptional activator of mexEF-oprN operon
MAPIDYANFAGIDLNLLVAFDALATERSVTRAASRIGIGQSAMSHSLARLRALFEDELFTRAADGMQPTPRALDLIAPVQAALAQILQITARRPDFIASSAQTSFRIGLPDSVEVLLIPSLLAHLQKHAPGVRLRLQVTSDAAHLLDELDAGRIDMAFGIGAFDKGREHHKRRALLSGNYLCMFNPALVGIEPPISLEDYVRLPHVLTSLRQGERGVVDDALEKIGLKRNVALTTPRFLAVPFLVRGAPVITTMHAELARLFSTALSLALSPPPVALPQISISLLWHTSYDRDPAHLWLRQTIFRLAADVAHHAKED